MKSLIKYSDLFERYWGLAVIFSHELSQNLKNYFDGDVFLLIKKKLFDDILFEILPIRIFHYLLLRT